MTTPCMMEAKIKSIEETASETDDKVTELVFAVKEIKKDIEEIKTTVTDHSVTLQGKNGNVGLVAAVNMIQESVGILVATTNSLVVALQGEKGDTGLVAAISALKSSVTDMRSGYVWVIRIIVGGVLAGVLALVLQ